MQINKTENFTKGKREIEPLSKKVTTAKATTVKPHLSISAPRSVLSLINSLKLPPDKLSASIVSFARFFSLPLKTEQLAEIRRQAFTSAPQTDTQTAKNPASVKTLEKTRTALTN